MSELVVKGPCKIAGELVLQGSKNSALPILAASILCKDESIIHNCPDLSDVRATIKILKYLGCLVEKEGNTIVVNSKHLKNVDIPDVLMREIRSSIVFLGALISRTGKAKLCFPGGCEIGLRPIDIHIKALREMGVNVRESHGYLECFADRGLQGANLSLSFPSVGATENIILTAVLAKGTTTITNAAQEPEIIDLADYLNACGAKIKGAGKSTVIIEGTDRLHSAEHTVIPDRIAAVTYMCAAAGTRGELCLKKARPEHLSQVLNLFREMGCKILVSKDEIFIKAENRLKALKLVRTMPYPGFPTDAQALLMALTCVAEGTSVFIENIFESRYKHVVEFNRMGANIKLEGRMAVVEGVAELYGTNVKATDLRAAAALAVVALMANGETNISGICYADRGYENLERNLKLLGADAIRRYKEDVFYEKNR